MVRQPLEAIDPVKRRPSAPPALSADTEWTPHAQAKSSQASAEEFWHEQAIQHHTATRGCIPGQPRGIFRTTPRVGLTRLPVR